MNLDWASGEIVGILTFLLPGFIAAEIFHSLTSHPKPSVFDRIVWALIFTLISQVIAEFAVVLISSETGPGKAMPATAVVVAVVLGLCASVISNTDILHRFLRWLRVTKETSYPSEWYSTFARHGENNYIVLHMQGERRLYGFAEEWPSDPKDGHFRIAEAEWLTADGGRVQLDNVVAILIPVAEVTMIEFLPVTAGSVKETK
ncbi:MAG: DUF6338 family protein [Rhodobacteraceae bacterium]|nr:DUF6338 family protein [Paracoccaceae bacterium]